MKYMRARMNLIFRMKIIIYNYSYIEEKKNRWSYSYIKTLVLDTLSSCDNSVIIKVISLRAAKQKYFAKSLNVIE